MARRVLLVSEPMQYGVLSYLARTCTGLDRSRWEPALAYSPRRMAPQAHDLVDRLAADGVRVRRLPFHRGFGPGDARAAVDLAREIRAFRPDVVHLHSTKAGLVGRVVAAACGVPALYTPHGTSWQYTGRRVGSLQLRLERALRRATTTLVSVCDEEAGAFVSEVGFDPERIRVVPNGVRMPDADELRRARAAERAAFGIGPDETWLVFVGRLTSEKGADVLLRALEAPVGADGVLVVGDGADRATLEARALATSVPVRFCGYQDDVTPFLAMADVFVQPSRSEGLPFAALEAMAHGLPVVASRVGGLPGAVDGAGVLVPPDDPAALRTALRAVCDDVALRGRLGRVGRTRVARRFDQNAMIAALESTYDAACRRPAAPAAEPATRRMAAAGAARPRP
jgi:glycosyltransferase involved in cell wall biosynthesis